MRNQQTQRTSVALFAAIASLVVYIAPAAVSADVVLKQKPLTEQQASLTSGQDLYIELCAVCHGQSGKGDGPAVPALKQHPTNLTALKLSHDNVFPREELEKVIYGRNRISAHGTLDMPIWGLAFELTKRNYNKNDRRKFAKERIHNIVEYIESLQIA